MRPLSHEYLSTFHEAARRALPVYQFADLQRRALPSSGGIARGSSPGTLEGVALAAMRPAHIRKFSDDELKRAWKSLGKWFGAAKRKKVECSSYVRAASHVLQEMKARGCAYSAEHPLAVEAFAKSMLTDRLLELPGEIEVLSCAASLAPGDLGPVLAYFGELEGTNVPALVTAALDEIGVGLEDVQPSPCPGPEGVPLYRLILSRAIPKIEVEIAAEDPLDTGVSVEDALQVVTSGDDGDDETIALSMSAPEGFARVLCSAPGEKQVIWYLVAEPDVIDMQGHKISRDEIEDACHRFMLGPRDVRMDHGELITGKAQVVESAIAPCGMETFQGQPLDAPIIAGSWFAGIYYPDAALWASLRDTSHGISWGGLAKKNTVGGAM